MSVRINAPLAWLVSLLVSQVAQAQVAATWTGSHDMNSSQAFAKTRATLLEKHPGGGLVATCVVNGQTVVNGYPAYADLGVSLVRWSNAGEKLWVRPLLSPEVRIPVALAVDAQGTSYVAGWGDTGFEVIAVDSSGNVAWSWTTPGIVYDLELTPAGDVIAVGSTASAVSDMLAQALSSSGQPLWTTTVDGPLSGGDFATAVAIDSNGESFLVGGFSAPSPYEVDAGLCRLDANGNLVWKQTLVGSPGWELADGITLAANGDLIVFGRVEGPLAGQYPAYIARLDAASNLLWEQTWGADHAGVWRTRIAADGSLWSLAWQQDEESFVSLLHHSADGVLLGSFDYDPPGIESTSARDFVFGSAGQMFVPLNVQTWITPNQTDKQGVLLEVDSNGTSSLTYPFEADPPSASDAYYGIAVLGPNHLAVPGTTSSNIGAIANVRTFDVSDSPGTYCVAKTNSAGCEPALGCSGFPSSSATGGFTIAATDELNQATGMFIYSLLGSAQQSFQSGTLCVKPPVRRTPTQNSGGTSLPAVDCSGSYLLDWNAFAQGLAGGNPSAALLVPGTGVWVQAWGRDKGSPPFFTSLSNGLSYVVLPQAVAPETRTPPVPPQR